MKPAPNPASESIAPQTTNRPVGFQHATAAGFPHCFLFDQTLGVRTFSISASWAACIEDKGHDDRFFSRCYPAGVESRKTETRSNRRSIAEARSRCPKADSLSGSFRFWSQGLLSCSPSSIGDSNRRSTPYQAAKMSELVVRSEGAGWPTMWAWKQRVKNSRTFLPCCRHVATTLRTRSTNLKCAPGIGPVR